MDNEQERYQHFQGFAELELEDLKPAITALFVAWGSPLSSRDEEIEKAQRLLKIKLAQRAYDLAVHTLSNAPGSDFEVYSHERIVNECIPDLTSWPKSQ